jgi:hypothetical protein
MSVLEKEIKTVPLRQFLEEHGQALGDRIEQELTPIYNPSVPDPILDKYDTKMDTLLRSPFPVQKEIVKGLSKALFNKGREKLFICGEMGTGKVRRIGVVKKCG